MSNSNRSAFPSHEACFNSDPRNRISGGGLTAREYYAAKALPAVIEHQLSGGPGTLGHKHINEHSAEAIAKQCFMIADAMEEESRK